MLKYFKAKFAEDRWEVLSLQQLGPRGDYVSETRAHLRNRYSHKLRLVTLRGEWRLVDFTDNTYRG
jgi:hypothetical protein